jgi:phospholipase/carboxylesterase
MSLSGPELPPQSGDDAESLVIMLHGVGSNGDDLYGIAPLLADSLPNTHFCSPNAPFEFDMAPFGYQWFSLQEYTPQAMLTGARAAAPILNAFIDEKLEELGLDDSKLVLFGFSQGTMMALYTAFRRPQACAGVLGYSGALIGGELLGKELKSCPEVCLVHGEEDEVVPFDAMQSAAHTLASNGAKVITHPRPMLGHGIDPEAIDIGEKFISSVLK